MLFYRISQQLVNVGATVELSVFQVQICIFVWKCFLLWIQGKWFFGTRDSHVIFAYGSMSTKILVLPVVDGVDAEENDEGYEDQVWLHW